MARFRMPPTGALVTLKHGHLELTIAPDCGARVVAFRDHGKDVLRPATPEALASAAPYGFAAFPLMPYSGPLFGDGFMFGGAFYPLGRNVPAEPSATHGEGWILPWSVLTRTPETIELGCVYAPITDAYPFRWRGAIEYRLTDTGLQVTMALTNEDTRPMPAGMGLHPYFPRKVGTTLRFEHGCVWPPDGPEAVDLAAVEPPEGLNFRAPRSVDGMVLDRCYEGWSGVATLAFADGSATRIEADPVFGKMQVYSPWGYDYICVEPVTNANDVFNRAQHGVEGHGVTVLAPGREMRGVIRISHSMKSTTT